MRTASILLAVVFVSGCATSGVGADYTPLVDLQYGQGDTYWRDLGECKRLSSTRGNASDAAATGALIGGLLAAALAPRGMKTETAAWGALFGAAGSSGAEVRVQADAVKACLTGRGYVVVR